MKKRLLRNIDWGILICTVTLIIIGLIALMSATQNSGLVEFKKQIQWVLICIPLVIAIICIDYEMIAKTSPVAYLLFIILLIGVLFTNPINGAKSWYDLGIFLFQPAEFAKIVVIVFLAYAITKVQERNICCNDSYGIYRKIKLDTLLLVETSARKLRYLMVNGNEYFCEGNISEMSHNLEKFGFFQIQRSYIVNMKYIKKIDSRKITLCNGLEIAIGRTHIAMSLKKRFLNGECYLIIN